MIRTYDTCGRDIIMKIEDGRDNLYEIVDKQILSHWTQYDNNHIRLSIDIAIKCMEQNMSELNGNCKYAHDPEGKVVFSPYNTVEYSIFLYYLSHDLYKAGHEKEASLVYYLNKIMNSVEWFYAIELPVHFWADHPLGSVLGRATYGDYLFVNQGVTVGGNSIGVLNDVYPTIGKNVHLCAGSSLIGDCHIGDNSVIAAGTFIRNQDVPANSIVYGISPNIVIKEKKNNEHIRPLWG